MMNGLYTISFHVGAQERSMVMVINDAQLKGGNTEYYYDGTCHFDGDQFSGHIVAKHYAGNTDQAFMNAKEIPLNVKGKINGNSISGEAQHLPSGMYMPFSAMKRD
jgi:hypothetical protein